MQTQDTSLTLRTSNARFRLRVASLAALAALLTVGAAMSATARTTEAAQEGLAAFIEKRKPEWK